MRKLAFLFTALAFSGSTFAADIPVKTPPPAPVPAYSWTGFYIGGNVGGGWDKRDINFSPNDPLAVTLFTLGSGAPPPTSFTSSGALGGLQLGYNWQFNRNWLFGLETDLDWSGIKGSA
jgi:outer membrane immunogenic protein